MDIHPFEIICQCDYALQRLLSCCLRLRWRLVLLLELSLSLLFLLLLYVFLLILLCYLRIFVKVQHVCCRFLLIWLLILSCRWALLILASFLLVSNCCFVGVLIFVLVSWSRLGWRILSDGNLLRLQDLIVLCGHEGVSIGWRKETCHFQRWSILNFMLILEQLLLRRRIRPLLLHLWFWLYFSLLLRILFCFFCLWTSFWLLLLFWPFHDGSFSFLWTFAFLFCNLPRFGRICLRPYQLSLLGQSDSILWWKIGFELLGLL